MTEHYLDPLLKPASIALVGASNREGSPGNTLARLVLNSSFKGTAYPVNPGYEDILGAKCYPDLGSLPKTVEHAVLAVSNERMETALDAAIEHGVKAVTLYASCVLEEDTDPPLKARLTERARQAGIAVCGGNGMGFYSIASGLYAGVFPMPGEMPAGSVTVIAQSGSAFSALAHNGNRLRFNLCVSSGNEMVTTVGDYMDWSLAQPSTRVIGLFLETVRDPEVFIRALERARDQQVPVVALKVGRSALGAEMAATHTGAIAGNHAAYEAVFRKYGVIQVSSLDEMAAALMLFQQEKRPGPGKLAAFFESGGFMEMVTDICEEIDLGFAHINDDTRSILKDNLEPGLKPDNPLDAWGSNDRFEERFYNCISAIMGDPSVATGVFFCNFRDGYYLSEAFTRLMLKINAETDKPIAMANCYSDIAHDSICEQANAGKLPFLAGTWEAMLGVQHTLQFRDRVSLDHTQTNPEFDPAMVDAWRKKLSSNSGDSLGESDAMALLRDFGIGTPDFEVVDTEEDAVSAANRVGYPVVLKTAEPGMDHKSDYSGVVVGIEDDPDMRKHYRDFRGRLGSRVIISSQVSAGTEVGLGVVRDPQFGPLIMVSAGGVFIELLSDRVVALAPVNRREADELVASLKLDTLIRGTRGRPPENRDALLDCIIRLSWIALEFADCIAEMDINPVIVNADSATAVDALVIRSPG